MRWPYISTVLMESGLAMPAARSAADLAKCPQEELYDLEADPDEVNNLARLPQQAAILDRFRRVQVDWMREIRDVGLLPEPEMHARSAGSTPYQMGHDEKRYSFERVRTAADRASALSPGATGQLLRGLADPDSGVRYWAASGLLMRGAPAVSQAAGDLRKALDDSSPSVRIAAAEALGRYGAEADVTRSISVLLNFASVTAHGPYLSLLALNSLDALGDKLRRVKPEVEALPVDAPSVDQRIKGNIKNLIDEIRKKQA